MCEKGRRARIWTPVFLLTIIITFFAFVVGQGLNSGMSVYLDGKGEPATLAGILMAVFSVAAAVSRIIVGPVIDNRGRRVVVLCGAALLAVGVLLPGLFPSTIPLVIGRVFQGAGFASATTAVSTSAADVLPHERMSEGIGYYGLGQALAMSVGPAFALYLVDTNPSENLFYVLTAISVLALLLSISLRYERNPKTLPELASYRVEHEQKMEAASDEAVGTDAARRESATDEAGSYVSEDRPREKLGLSAIFEKGALPGAIPMLLMSCAFGFCISFAGLYGSTMEFANTGLFFTLSAVCMIVTRFLSKPLMNSIALMKTFAIAVCFGVACFALMLSSSESEVLFYISGLCYGGCLGISLPLNQSIAMRNTPPARWGAASALFLLANDVGIGGSSIIWGVTNDILGFQFTICCALACVVISYILALIVYPPFARSVRKASRHDA